MTKTIVSVVGGATGASVLGGAHAGRLMPNQDAVGWRQSRLWTYLAVADGHGSARHHRSDRGARMAVDAVLGLLLDATGQGRLRDPEALGRRVPALGAELAQRWRVEVEADIAADPVSEPAGFDSLAVYGSTCLGVAIGPGLTLLLQIGDGELYVGVPSGDVEQPFPTDDLDGEQTYSLCLPDATDYVKVALFTAPSRFCAPDFVFATTDGFIKAFPDKHAARGAVCDRRKAVRDRGLAAFASELEPWLDRCAQAGGDDVSVAIFTVDDGEVDPVASPKAQPITAPRELPHRSAGVRALALACLVGLVSGILLDRWAPSFRVGAPCRPSASDGVRHEPAGADVVDRAGPFRPAAHRRFRPGGAGTRFATDAPVRLGHAIDSSRPPDQGRDLSSRQVVGQTAAISLVDVAAGFSGGGLRLPQLVFWTSCGDSHVGEVGIAVRRSRPDETMPPCPARLSQTGYPSTSTWILESV